MLVGFEALGFFFVGVVSVVFGVFFLMEAGSWSFVRRAIVRGRSSLRCSCNVVSRFCLARGLFGFLVCFVVWSVF